VNTRLQTWLEAYHDIAVDVFDDEIANIFDRSIAMVIVQCPGGAGRVVRWLRVDPRK
jgi:hypothetical protein